MPQVPPMPGSDRTVDKPISPRDVRLGEDRSRIRNNPGIFAFVFEVRQTDTIGHDRYRAALAGIGHLITLRTLPDR